MANTTDVREYIAAIEQLIFEQSLNRENKKVSRALLHIRTVKEIIAYDDNPQVLNKWYLALVADYDRLCNIVFEKLKQQEQRKAFQQQHRQLGV